MSEEAITSDALLLRLTDGQLPRVWLDVRELDVHEIGFAGFLSVASRSRVSFYFKWVESGELPDLNPLMGDPPTLRLEGGGWRFEAPVRVTGIRQDNRRVWMNEVVRDIEVSVEWILE